VNYSYFISQLTTFVYLPVNFIAIIIKVICTSLCFLCSRVQLLFTNHITKDQRDFPKYKVWFVCLDG